MERRRDVLRDSAGRAYELWTVASGDKAADVFCCLTCAGLVSVTFPDDLNKHCCGECGSCDGTGTVEVPHPRWGSLSCPSPTVARRCPECAGGEVA